MDYSESIIYLRAYVNKAHDALNNRKYKQARDLAKEITAEALQLEKTIDNIIEVLGNE